MLDFPQNYLQVPSIDSHQAGLKVSGYGFTLQASVSRILSSISRIIAYKPYLKLSLLPLILVNILGCSSRTLSEDHDVAISATDSAMVESINTNIDHNEPEFIKGNPPPQEFSEQRGEGATEIEAQSEAGEIRAVVAESKLEEKVPVPLLKPLLEPFSVQYRTRIKFGLLKLDVNATRTLKQLQDNEWEIRFDATASIGQISEYSRFRLINNKIEPILYRRRASGLIDRYNRTLQFDTEAQQIIDLETDLPLEIEWQDGMQNDLTYMLQIVIDLKNKKENFGYPVYQKSRVKSLNFRIDGNEQIKTQAGIFNTLKISQVRSDNKQVEAWFTDDDTHHFIRLLDRKNGEIRYRIDAVSIDS